MGFRAPCPPDESAYVFDAPGLVEVVELCYTSYRGRSKFALSNRVGSDSIHSFRRAKPTNFRGSQNPVGSRV